MLIKKRKNKNKDTNKDGYLEDLFKETGKISVEIISTPCPVVDGECKRDLDRWSEKKGKKKERSVDYFDE